MTIDGVEAFPLQWPNGWERSRPSRARFDTNFVAARDGLIRELSLLGATHVVISTNIPLRRDGLPYANQAQPDDKGVAVYFLRESKQQCIPCDRWDRVVDNLQAIRKTVEALRGLERWGAKNTVDAAFTGFQALPPSRLDKTFLFTNEAVAFISEYSDILESAILRNPDQFARAYRRASKRLHPDSGGSKELFQKLQEAKRFIENGRKL